MARSKRRWLVIAIFTVLLLGSASPAGAQEADDALVASPPDVPTEVFVWLDVDDISGVNEREGFVEMSGTLIVDWDLNNEDCAPEDLLYQGESARDELKKRWWPQFVLRDGIGARETKSLSLRVSCADEIAYAVVEERFQANVAQDFSLEDFPFDDHELSFTIMSSAQNDNEVRIFDPAKPEGPPETVGERRQASSFEWPSPEWHVEDFGAALVINPSELGTDFGFDFEDPALYDNPDELYSYFADSEGANRYFADPTEPDSYYGDLGLDYSTTTFQVEIDRIPEYYIKNIILPLVLIVSISWVVFWGNRGRMTLAERLGISITCLLTVVAYDFLTGDSLPRLSYMTRLDSFYNVSYLFVALTVVLSVISAGRPSHDRRTRTTDSGDDDAADENDRPAPTRIDRISRWAVPLAYFVAVGLSLLGMYPGGA